MFEPHTAVSTILTLSTFIQYIVLDATTISIDFVAQTIASFKYQTVPTTTIQYITIFESYTETEMIPATPVVVHYVTLDSKSRIIDLELQTLTSDSTQVTSYSTTQVLHSSDKHHNH